MLAITTHKFFNELKSSSKPELFEEYITTIKKEHTIKSSETEAHHIFPTSIFGKNLLTVNVPIKIHFRLHVLLWKMLLDNNAARKMANAVHKMMQGRPNFTEDDYKIAREAIQFAKKDRSTVYDKVEQKYIKGKVDDIRYFGLFPVKTPDGKRTWKSPEDPIFKLCTKAESIQSFRDLNTGEMVSIEVTYASTFPDRYVHCKTGNKTNSTYNKGMNTYYDPEKLTPHRMSTKEAKERGFLPCTNYTEIKTGKIFYIPSALAKLTPGKYIHSNKNKVDVLHKAKNQVIKIKQTDFDPEIHARWSNRLGKISV